MVRQMQAIGRRAGLAGMEIIQGAVLSDEEWTPQNVSFQIVLAIGIRADETQNMVTATSKLNRRAISERYQKDIKNAYKK